MRCSTFWFFKNNFSFNDHVPKATPLSLCHCHHGNIDERFHTPGEVVEILVVIFSVIFRNINQWHGTLVSRGGLLNFSLRCGSECTLFKNVLSVREHFCQHNCVVLCGLQIRMMIWLYSSFVGEIYPTLSYRENSGVTMLLLGMQSMCYTCKYLLSTAVDLISARHLKLFMYHGYRPI